MRRLHGRAARQKAAVRFASLLGMIGGRSSPPLTGGRRLAAAHAAACPHDGSGMLGLERRPYHVQMVACPEAGVRRDSMMTVTCPSGWLFLSLVMEV